MRTLQRITEMYKVDTEAAATQLIQEFKDKTDEEGYLITKYESKHHNKKAKGVVIDEWYIVTIQKDYTLEE